MPLLLPELLCPAGDEAALRAAVDSGANAVYLGYRAFGARAKCAVSQIDRVGAAVHGGAQGGLIPGGAEQFGKQQGHGRFAHFRSE